MSIPLTIDQTLHELFFGSKIIDQYTAIQTIVWYDFDRQYGIIESYEYDCNSVGATMFGSNPRRFTPSPDYRVAIALVDGSPLDVLNELVGHTHKMDNIHPAASKKADKDMLP